MAVRIVLTMTFPNETEQSLREKVIRGVTLNPPIDELDEIDAVDVAAYVRVYDYGIELDEEWISLD